MVWPSCHSAELHLLKEGNICGNILDSRGFRIVLEAELAIGGLDKNNVSYQTVLCKNRVLTLKIPQPFACPSAPTAIVRLSPTEAITGRNFCLSSSTTGIGTLSRSSRSKFSPSFSGLGTLFTSLPNAPSSLTPQLQSCNIRDNMRSRPIPWGFSTDLSIGANRDRMHAASHKSLKSSAFFAKFPFLYGLFNP